MDRSGKTKKSAERGEELRIAGRIACNALAAIAICVIAAMLIYSFVAISIPAFCPSAGGNILVAVTDDAVYPDFTRGNAAVMRAPSSENEVHTGAFVAYRSSENGAVSVRIRKVAGRIYGSEPAFTVTDNDGVQAAVKYSDIIGVYTGKKYGALGGFLSALGSSAGTVVLSSALVVVCGVWVAVRYISRHRAKVKLERAAFDRSLKELSRINLRYDNICEITAVSDVLEMLANVPKTGKAYGEWKSRLQSFVDAQTIELPKTPETAAVLDSLPAPCTPDELAAALRSGATLRQSEDGQTLVLTGLSGGKTVLLTPIQTPDGIMLCRQGVRIRAEIAPNLEHIGETSMPGFPDFFVGQPLEKHIEYPELPSPHEPFGPSTLNSYGEPVPQTVVSEDGAVSPRPALSSSVGTVPFAREITSHSEFDAYRALAAPRGAAQAKKLDALVSSALPLSPEEKAMVDKYRQEHKKHRAPKKPLTEEQLAAKRAAAQARSKKKQDFIDSLSPADKEQYFAEQHLNKLRAAAIRRLKRLEADRKILEQLKDESK